MSKESAVHDEALQKGLAYNQANEWSEGLAAFRAALRAVPTSARAYAGLGESCIGLKQLDRALDCYKSAVRLSKGDIVYLQKVADIQERMGQLSEAGRTYMAAGELAFRRNLHEQAISNWERAVRIEPHLLSGHRRLAMTFQRQGNTTASVREYLAIARILQARGEDQKALQMCRAALRLDPKSENVRTAVDLIIHGEKAFPTPEAPPEPEPPPEEPADTMASALRQMATVFETETANWRAKQTQTEQSSPIAQAQQLAQQQLAEEIFREEEEDGESEISKLERDALLGQGIDFQTRGLVEQAIGCYEKAVDAGLQLPAVHFTLGYLYLQEQQNEPARRELALAAQSRHYETASQWLLRKL
ncbi:MAG: tetratricopeptide repeat protein [Chloroflexota bacterium]